MDSLYAPVVLFVYDRLFHTQETVSSLQKNILAEKTDLFIYSDAAKTAETTEQVLQVRKYIATIKGFKNIHIIERETNNGLAQNIINGVTSVINKYGKIIVVEDDLVLSPFFLSFMNAALNYYIDEEKVFHISGYMFPIKRELLPDTFFSKAEFCWGWATWKRAWKYFIKDADYYHNNFSKQEIYDFNLNNSNNFFKQIILNKDGILNTWAIFWYASIYKNNGLCINPSLSYVNNIGHDGTGVNCSKNNNYITELNQKSIINFENCIEESIEGRKALIDFFKTIKKPFILIFKSFILSILKTHLQRFWSKK